MGTLCCVEIDNKFARSIFSTIRLAKTLLARYFLMDHSSNSGNFKTAAFADCLTNSKEIFQLIDRVFPVDSCRHYEVLPLQLAGDRLAIGMLEPSNDESLKFVNSIARVFGYRLEVQLLDRQTLQIILASYPGSTQSPPPPEQNPTIIDNSFNSNIVSDERRLRRRKLADSAPTIISQPDKSQPSQPKTSQNLPDLPPDLDFLQDLDLSQQPSNNSPKPPIDAAATLYEIPPEFRDRQAAKNLDNKPTIIGSNPTELLAQEGIDNESDAASEAQISALIAETLGSVPQQAEAGDFLPGLMPQLSWQKLLEQAFKHQSEWIELNLRRDRGSIIASRNESVQSTVDRVPLPIFCSLIDEIKRMARIPQDTTSHPKKVVLERFYRQERILLRIKFGLQESMQKVEVQIMRDRALRNYEQQQMDKVSQQALQQAQQLEKSLRRIQACFDCAELNNLNELQAVYHKIGHQLRMLDK